MNPCCLDRPIRHNYVARGFRRGATRRVLAFILNSSDQMTMVMANRENTGKRAELNQDRGAELDQRLERLSQALQKERSAREPVSRQDRAGATGYGQALRMSSEFAAAVLVGAVLGWGLDVLAGTSPFGLIVFLLLGFVAGVLNVIRASGSLKSSDPSDTE